MQRDYRLGPWPAFVVAAVLTGLAHAQAPEKPTLTLGVGGKGLLYYLLLTLAERLGYFKEQGLDVTIPTSARPNRCFR